MKTLSSKVAWEIAETIKNLVASKGQGVCIEVVNSEGGTLVTHLMDRAKPVARHVASVKARQSAYTGKRTSTTFEEIKEGKTTWQAMGLAPEKQAIWAGGVPIYCLDGRRRRLIGAVGVSGLSASKDEEVAIEGVESIEGLTSDKPI